MPNHLPADHAFLGVPVDVVATLGALRRNGESLGGVIGRLAAAAAAASTPVGAAVASPTASRETAMNTFLRGGPFLAERNATTQFLAILGHAIAQQPGSDATLVAANRVFGGRTQFGSEADVANSGVATRPLPIPGSTLFALTNLSTADKRKILGQALQVLGYGQSVIATAQAALGHRPAAGAP